MIGYMDKTVFLGEYFEDKLKTIAKEDGDYAALIDKAFEKGCSLGMTPDAPHDAPIVLFYEALMDKNYYERELLYAQGWKDCLAVLRELRLLPRER